MKIYIQNITNNVYKEVKSLHQKKYRDRKKIFFIEGLRFFEEALKANLNLEYIIISDTFKDSNNLENIFNKQCNLRVYSASDKIFEEISDTTTPQGIMAVMKNIECDEEKFHKQVNNIEKAAVLVLDSVQDPGNMGTIIRTADAAGINGIIISKGCVDIYNPKVLRATMGSIFRVPVVQSEDLKMTISQLRMKKFIIFAAHLAGTKNYFEVNFKRKTAIIIGNEANGIEANVAECCDSLLKIPMIGDVESLNAAVSASLIMYEILRQKIVNCFN